MKPVLLTVVCAALIPGVFMGCEEHKPQVKKTADALKEAGARTGEALKDAGAKTGEAFKEAGAKTSEAVKESTDKVRATIHEATKPPAPAEPAPAQPPTAEPASASQNPLDRTVTDIDGNEVNLAAYRGKVVLIVNVASKCGYTPQYAGLERMYAAKKDQGLVLLGFPSNDFGKQEPGTEAEIKAFCTDTYNVDFPMFAKVSVKGEHASELYKQLAAAAPGGTKPLGEPKWNFTKYLIDRKGGVVAKFDSGVAPDDAKLTAAIDAALAAK